MEHRWQATPSLSYERGVRRARIALAALFLLALPPAVAWLRAGLGTIRAELGLPVVAGGTALDGWILGAVSLPPRAEGLRSYSVVGSALGRQHVHPRLAQALLAAGEELRDPPLVIGETGWRTGGLFFPHLTHRNGLSVDIFVPLDEDEGEGEGEARRRFALGESFGYATEVDAQGRSPMGTVDLDRLHTIVQTVCRQAMAHGLRPVHFHLRDAWSGKAGACGGIRGKNPALDHDDHFHLDFVVEAR